MAQTVKIISDSTCDLSKDLVEKYDISILPLHILLGEDEYRDGVDITPEEIFRWSDRKQDHAQDLCSFSDRGHGSHAAFCGRRPGDHLFLHLRQHVHLRQRYAACCRRTGSFRQSHRHQLRKPVHRHRSAGNIQAAILASEGKTAAEITTAIEAIRPKVRASFVVDTLTYLHRGGRCGAVAALAGGMLKLHPRIVVVDGAMDASKKYRGEPGFRHPLLHQETWKRI